jgi:hypothetical protein
MPYRDEKEALRARLEELDKNLSHIDARARELDELKQDEPTVRKERDALRQKLRDLEGPRKLPVLENLSVASPCHEKWDDMVGDETARFCLKCEKNVYDLSSMSREQAESLITAKEGKLCVRFYRRADGTVLTADCPEGVARKRRRNLAAGVVGASLLAAGGFAVASSFTRTQGACKVSVGQAMQGEVASPHAVEPVMEMGKMAGPPTMGHVAAPARPQPPPDDPNALPFTPPKK